MQLSSVRNYTQWAPYLHPCLLQLCLNMIHESSCSVFITAVSYAQKCPIRPQNRPLLLALPPACWSPKIPWIQFTSCFAHLHPCWESFGWTPLPVSALPAKSQPVLRSNFSTLWQLRPTPFLGWIKKVRNSIPRGSSLGQQSRGGEQSHLSAGDSNGTF